MPRPRTLFSLGKTGSGRSSPNRARDNANTIERYRIEDRHVEHVGTSRSVNGALDELRSPQMLQVNAPKASTVSSPLLCGTSYVKPNAFLHEGGQVPFLIRSDATSGVSPGIQPQSTLGCSSAYRHS